jgi:hypothetical protein
MKKFISMEYINDFTETAVLPNLVRPILLPHDSVEQESSTRSFIEANTVESSLFDIKRNHIIPVWLKDNEPLVSHTDFIETTQSVVQDIFHGEHILKPIVRLSHPIKGRIPSAKDKPAHQLTDDERTISYERMMFAIEVPSIKSVVDGNELSLTIGGVKSFSEDNLYQRSGGDQHFKLFIGFKNKVCTNLCVWSDGYVGNLSLKSKEDLYLATQVLLQRYNSGHHLFHLQKLSELSITENQFAHLIGRCRMYQHLPNSLKQNIPPMLFGENQMGAVVKDYYRDQSFCRQADGNINLWRLYNLFTGANKSSYIDQFLDRSVNAYHFAEQLRWALEGRQENWYLN